MFCPECGTQNADKAKYCKKCGTILPMSVVTQETEVSNINDTEELVRRAKKHDQDAISRIYRQTYSSQYHIARILIKDEDAALDIVQDAYVKAFLHLDQLEDAGKLEAWLKNITTNTAKDWLKKNKPLLFTDLAVKDQEEIEQPFEDTIEDKNEGVIPENFVDDQETKRLIGEILQNLPDDQRIVIGMFYYEDMPVKNIAEILDVSENTVKSRLNYGRKKIKEAILELEKRGTKLYGLAAIPFLLALFGKLDAHAAEKPNALILRKIFQNFTPAENNVARTTGAETTNRQASFAETVGVSDESPLQDKAADVLKKEKVFSPSQFSAATVGNLVANSAKMKIVVAILCVVAVGGIAISIIKPETTEKEEVTAEESAALSDSEEMAEEAAAETTEQAATAEEAVVYADWQDDVFENSVASALEKETDEVTVDDLAGITELYIIGDDSAVDDTRIVDMHNACADGKAKSVTIRNLSDISEDIFPNLETLYLQFCNLDDAALSTLDLPDKVTLINLDDNNLTNLNALAGCTNLKTISVARNNISDYSGIEDFIDPENTYTDGNPVEFTGKKDSPELEAQVYGKTLQDLMDQHGTVSIVYRNDLVPGDETPLYQGVMFADLLDMNGDGIDELVVAWCDDVSGDDASSYDYRQAVYSMKNGEAKLLDEEGCMTDGAPMGVYLYEGEIDGLPILSGEDGWFNFLRMKQDENEIYKDSDHNPETGYTRDMYGDMTCFVLNFVESNYPPIDRLNETLSKLNLNEVTVETIEEPEANSASAVLGTDLSSCLGMMPSDVIANVPGAYEYYDDSAADWPYNLTIGGNISLTTDNREADSAVYSIILNTNSDTSYTLAGINCTMTAADAIAVLKNNGWTYNHEIGWTGAFISQAGKSMYIMDSNYNLLDDTAGNVRIGQIVMFNGMPAG